MKEYELYSTYTADELAQDEFFVRWVLQPTEELAHFWEVFRKENPSKNEDVETARELVLLARLVGEYDFFENENLELKDQKEDTIRPLLTNQLYLGRYMLRYGALALLILLGIYWYSESHQTVSTSTIVVSPTQNEDSLSYAHVIKAEDKERFLKLEDGSVVVLAPHSELRYNSFKEQKERKVDLQGNAFFEVVPNSKKPFVVITQSLNTFVKGTSFYVSHTSDREPTIVSVKTGVVGVVAPHTHSAEEQVLIKKNQSATYNPNSVSMQMSDFVPIPQLTMSNITFQYTNAKFISVFQDLEKAYGIKVICKNKEIFNNKITGLLDEEHLNEKLKVLAKVADCQFKIANDHVVFYSNSTL